MDGPSKYPIKRTFRDVSHLVSAAELYVETAQDIGEILSLYRNDGFGFSDLMIRQAHRGG